MKKKIKVWIYTKIIKRIDWLIKRAEKKVDRLAKKWNHWKKLLNEL